MSAGGTEKEEREGESLAGTEADTGLELPNCEIMT